MFWQFSRAIVAWIGRGVLCDGCSGRTSQGIGSTAAIAAGQAPGQPTRRFKMSDGQGLCPMGQTHYCGTWAPSQCGLLPADLNHPR